MILSVVLISAIYMTSVFSDVSIYSCSQKELVIYGIEFVSNWSKDLFPKQYPTWRPPAQWSKVIGVSHDKSYKIYQLGVESSPQFKVFVETGKFEGLIGEIRRNDSQHLMIDTFDEFVLTAIKPGMNKTEGRFFADGAHSKVSVVSKLIPSPDWFVGIDSLELCSDGHWIDQVVIEASPLDAGTDSGFTFTAPNWPTVPQEKIFKITAQYPRHPANSFYYPSLEDLPPIAYFKITKNRVFTQTHLPGKIKTKMTVSDKFLDNETQLLENKIPKVRKRNRVLRNKKPINCQVSPWGAWSSCKKICGPSVRTRKVIVEPNKSGEPCPPLREEKMCECNKAGLFNW